MRASTSCALHANSIRAQRKLAGKSLPFFAYVFIKSAPCISHNCERLRMPAAYARGGTWRPNAKSSLMDYYRNPVGKLGGRGGGGGGGATRETREGWTLLTVETEVNGYFLGLVRWSRGDGTIDFCPALAGLVSPVQNIIFLTVHFFTLLVPIAQQPGQAGVLGRLSLCICQQHTTHSHTTEMYPSHEVISITIYAKTTPLHWSPSSSMSR